MHKGAPVFRNLIYTGIVESLLGAHHVVFNLSLSYLLVFSSLSKDF